MNDYSIPKHAILLCHDISLNSFRAKMQNNESCYINIASRIC